MAAADISTPLAREPIVALQASHARDYGAAITMFLVIVFYNVTDLALRTESQTGLAFRNVYLRRVLWILLAATAGALIIGALRGIFRGSRTTATATRLTDVAELVGSGLLILFVINAGLFVWFAAAPVTVAPLTAWLAIGALAGALLLAAPWKRIPLWRGSVRQMVPALVIAFAVLLVWEVLLNVLEVKQFLLPKPTVITQNLAETFPDLISKSWVTFQNALWGYAIGCGAGVLVGLASARFPAFSRAILPFAIAANSTPIIAFAPIMGFWFGVLNPASKIAIVAIMVFFPCMINTVRGLLSADQCALELMRSLATNELTTFRKVRFPAALPYIFNGLKFGTSWSVIAAVVGEFFGGSTQGIGFYIKNKPTEFNFPAAWSAIVIVSLLGILFYLVVSLVERVVMPWHVSFRTPGK